MLDVSERFAAVTRTAGQIFSVLPSGLQADTSKLLSTLTVSVGGVLPQEEALVNLLTALMSELQR